MHLLRLRIGIDEDQRVAALQHELVDGVERLVGQVLRMDDHQHVDVVRHLVDVGRDRLHVVELLQLLDHDIGHHRAALHRRHQVAFERQRRHQPDHRLLREGEAVDQLGQIVFEEALALGLEERDDLLVVGRVGGGEAEIDLLAALVERHALEPEGDGAILGRRERLGIEDLQLDLAVGRGRVFLEHLAHALRIDAVGRHLVAELRRIVEAQHDRLVDLAERVARALATACRDAGPSGRCASSATSCRR